MFVRDFSRCPRCGAPTKKATSFNNGESEFWYTCSKQGCNTYINTYIPQEHQYAVHEDPHLFVGNFGGYGSGKTLTSREEVYKHVFLTPGGNTLIGANVQSQYDQTIKRDIENDLPLDFYAQWSSQKQAYDYINGHRIMYRPFDDPNKLRSYNLSMFVMVEASEIKAESFVQLKTRLRNMTAGVPKRHRDGTIVTKKTKTGVLIPVMQADWRKGIIESNPDSGWIREDILDKSDVIYKHGRIPDIYALLANEKDTAISTHITASAVNEFLPTTFVEDNCKNKPAWWINRYIFGSFLYAEGLVYPSSMRWLEDPFEIPKEFPRICAYDYGLSDDSVFLFAAVDMKAGIIHVYKEIRTNNRSVEDLAKLFFEGSADIPVGGWICPPIIDPKSGPKRDYEKKTLADHFLDYGIVFMPGQISVDARVYRLNTYLECGKIRISKECEGLIRELKNYKFKTKTLSNDSFDDKPVDKDNHAINPLEWITMELPSDPRKLISGVYDKQGRNLVGPQLTDDDIERSYASVIFQDEDQYPTGNGTYDMIDYTY